MNIIQEALCSWLEETSVDWWLEITCLKTALCRVARSVMVLQNPVELKAEGMGGWMGGCNTM